MKPKTKRSARVNHISNDKKLKKAETPTDEETSELLLVNGTENNRKRKGEDKEGDVIVKKIKTDTVKTEDNVLASNKKDVPSKEGKTGSKTKTATKEIFKGQKVAVKRQKVLLDVPKLSSVSGVLYVVGNNEVGQLGLDLDIMGKKRPAEISFPEPFIDIAAGGMHSVCLTSRGKIYTFGCNDEGALGRITDDEEYLEHNPRLVDIPGVVVQISAGDSHSAALTDEGDVFVWGNFRSSDGSIGLVEPGEKCILPVRILKDVKVVSIASGADHLVCLTDDGQVYTCGTGECGQLGRVTERSSKGTGRSGLRELLQPKLVPLKNDWKPISSIWTGSYGTFLKTKSNFIVAFGLNNFTQLGLEPVIGPDGNDRKLVRFSPEIVPSCKQLDWKCISGGQHHTLALDSKGQVYSFGRKDYGRLGLGKDCTDKSEPTVIPALANKKTIQISSGNVVSFALIDNGEIYSWGFGESHQLGHGSEEDCYDPKVIEGNFRQSCSAIKVSGGGQHTLILANKKETEDKGK